MVRFFIITAAVLFSIIGIAVLMKGNSKQTALSSTQSFSPIEIELEKEIYPIATQLPEPTIIASPTINAPIATPLALEENKQTPPPPSIHNDPVEEKPSSKPSNGLLNFSTLPKSAEGLPTADRISQLFDIRGAKLPFVETILYSSKTPWQKGSPAWISDYARHYETSRHFIARSLNGKADYLKQDVSNGDRFNVFRLDKNIQFHLLVDLSRCKMWFYCLDGSTNERFLLKTYDVCLGRPESTKKSGMLTPAGKYSLGNRVATYRPGVMGLYKGQQVEMMRVFGTRWIPFEKELDQTIEPAKSLGIHGLPWILDTRTEKLKEDINSIGKYESDGCIRMASSDIEEIYAIVITKPTVIQLVYDFYDAALPGTERGGNL